MVFHPIQVIRVLKYFDINSHMGSNYFLYQWNISQDQDLYKYQLASDKDGIIFLLLK